MIKMKNTEELQKSIQHLVDLTKQDDVNSTSSIQVIKMPELALVMSKYFLALSKVCLTHYHSYSKTQKKIEREKSQLPAKQKYKEQQFAPPKKPLTAYILYFQDRVPHFQQKYPKYTISELTRLIAKEWKEITAAERQPYLTKAADDRLRYHNQMKQYKLSRGLKQIDEQENIRNAQDKQSQPQSLVLESVKRQFQQIIEQEQAEDEGI